MATDLDALSIADRSMRIAAGMCVYTNTNFVVDALPALTEEEKALIVAANARPAKGSNLLI